MRTITKLIRNGIKLKRANRPERIRQAIVKATGERIRVFYIGIYICEVRYRTLYFPNDLVIIDTPEEGD